MIKWITNKMQAVAQRYQTELAQEAMTRLTKAYVNSFVFGIVPVDARCFKCRADTRYSEDIICSNCQNTRREPIPWTEI